MHYIVLALRPLVRDAKTIWCFFCFWMTHRNHVIRDVSWSEHGIALRVFRDSLWHAVYLRHDLCFVGRGYSSIHTIRFGMGTLHFIASEGVREFVVDGFFEHKRYDRVLAYHLVSGYGMVMVVYDGGQHMVVSRGVEHPLCDEVLRVFFRPCGCFLDQVPVYLAEDSGNFFLARGWHLTHIPRERLPLVQFQLSEEAKSPHLCPRRSE